MVGDESLAMESCQGLNLGPFLFPQLSPGYSLEGSARLDKRGVIDVAGWDSDNDGMIGDVGGKARSGQLGKQFGYILVLGLPLIDRLEDDLRPTEGITGKGEVDGGIAQGEGVNLIQNLLVRLVNAQYCLDVSLRDSAEA